MSAVRERVLARFQQADGEVDEALLPQLLADEAPLLGQLEFIRTLDELKAHVSGLGRIEPLTKDKSVSDILINGDGTVWVEARGRLMRTEISLQRHEVLTIVERVLGPLGKTVDRSHPIADARLADGSRISVVLDPLAVDGPAVSIRRFAAEVIDLGAFCPPAVQELLVRAVECRANILIYGGTGSGKTTLLNSLCTALPHHHRVITIEDAAELRLPHPHVVRLEARTANAEGAGEHTIRDLIRAALRMRPDRLIVGEIRGAEAVDMIWAMSSGHEGSLSTIHANTTLDALLRVETFALLAHGQLPLEVIRCQVASAVDLAIGIARNAHGERSIVRVDEIVEEPSTRRFRQLADAVGQVGEPARRWATEGPR